jgi:protein-disulfide isomerase-like protein with CxxC motif
MTEAAKKDGRGDAMKDRLLFAYMTEGEMISDRETLGRLAKDVGLEDERVRAMLASDSSHAPCATTRTRRRRWACAASRSSSSTRDMARPGPSPPRLSSTFWERRGASRTPV